MDRPEENDPEFEALIAFVQESRGVDFRGYKRTSLRRRMTLRLNELGLDSFAAYYSFLEAHPQEFTNLLNTVLINVTSFFRDPEAWDALRRQVVPAIIGHNREREIRLWSVGCASGQEAYSLAMALAEPLGIGEFCRRVKIYATDLDEPALEVARHATYTLREVESVPPELLDKYFERVNYHYVFHRELRKCVIFGRHNVVRDAPISRIELLLCRNLLIYLETETQNIVLPRLHYALKDHGYLFLGRAETQLARSRLFQSVDMRSRIFMKVPQEWRRTPAGGLVIREEELPGESSRQIQIQDAIANSSTIAYLAINAEGRLVFANPAARRMLDVGEADLGRPFQDLPISYRPTELRSRIEEAQQQARPIKIENQEWPRGGGESLRLSIEVTPIFGRDNKPFITLVAFSDSTQMFQLQQELEAAQESLETTVEELQSANEELETTNEELQSTNEELETTNEELQSTNEELETINEELRSSNEELEAANEELRSRSEEFAQYRRYVESVLGSFDAGVIVLDQYGTAQFWNRWCENVFGLRSDEVVQRSFFDLDIGLPVHKLREPFERVAKGQETFSRINLQGIDRRGRNIQCAIRISPLVPDSKSSTGTLLIIEDLSDIVRNEEFTQYLGRIIGESLNEVYFLNPQSLQFTLVNQGAERKLGYRLAQLRYMSLADFMPFVSVDSLRSLAAPLLKQEKEEIVFETVLRPRTGQDYPAEICMQYFASEDPAILVAIVHDTGERQRVPAEPAASADGN